MLARLGRLADRLLEVAAVAAPACAARGGVVGVVSRADRPPGAWSDEMRTYLLVWIGFVGWISPRNRGSHIRIHVLIDRLPRGCFAVRWRSRSRSRRDFFGRPADPSGLRPLIERNCGHRCGSACRCRWRSLYVPAPIAAAALIVQAAAAIFDAIRVRASRTSQRLGHSRCDRDNGLHPGRLVRCACSSACRSSRPSGSRPSPSSGSRGMPAGIIPQKVAQAQIRFRCSPRRSSS